VTAVTRGACPSTSEWHEYRDKQYRDLGAALDQVYLRRGVPEELRDIVRCLLELPIASRDLALGLVAKLDGERADIERERDSIRHRFCTDPEVLYTCDTCCCAFPDRELTYYDRFSRWCPDCFTKLESRAERREFSIQSALHRARSAKLPATLTETQWAETLASFAYRCAYCGMHCDVVEHVTPVAGGMRRWHSAGQLRPCVLPL
jgi:hypothetical protein